MFGRRSGQLGFCRRAAEQQEEDAVCGGEVTSESLGCLTAHHSPCRTPPPGAFPSTEICAFSISEKQYWGALKGQNPSLRLWDSQKNNNGIFHISPILNLSDISSLDFEGTVFPIAILSLAVRTEPMANCTFINWSLIIKAKQNSEVAIHFLGSKPYWMQWGLLLNRQA